jgi:hypothetical protein
MMKWGWDYSRELPDTDFVVRKSRGLRSVSLCDDGNDSIDLNNPIMFKVEAVQGGTLVETRWYDHKKDENERKLHIVTPDEDLAEAIGKIVTMELIRR